MFWVTLAAMTVLAALAVLLPLVRRRTAAAAPDLAIYRDQLAEVDRDLAAGLVTAAEAEAARVEVKRRLLAAADRIAAAGAPGAGRGRRWAVAAAGLVVVPLLAVGLYLVIGVPDLPDQPLTARREAPSDHQDLAALIEQVEARLAENPDDGRGWEVLAPVYMRSGRYADAVKANQNVIRLLGDSADRLANLGEALFAAASDHVTARSPHQLRARRENGSQAAQGALLPRRGRPPGRQPHRGQRALAHAAQRDAGRLALARGAGAVAGRAGSRGGQQAAAGTAHRERAQCCPLRHPASPVAKPAARQTAVTRAMVEMLAQKLKTSGGDAEDWMRLLRGHMSLGDTDKARAALADARTALKGEPDKLKNVEMFAKGLGLGG